MKSLPWIYGKTALINGFVVASLLGCGDPVPLMRYGTTKQFHGSYIDADVETAEKSKNFSADNYDGSFSILEVTERMELVKVTGNPYSEDLERETIAWLIIDKPKTYTATIQYTPAYLEKLKKRKSAPEMKALAAKPEKFTVASDELSATQVYEPEVGPQSVKQFRRLKLEEVEAKTARYNEFKKVRADRRKSFFDGNLKDKTFILASRTDIDYVNGQAQAPVVTEAANIKYREPLLNPTVVRSKDEGAPDFINVKRLKFLNEWQAQVNEEPEAKPSDKMVMDVRFSMKDKQSPLQISFWQPGKPKDVDNWSVSGVIEPSLSGLDITKTVTDAKTGQILKKRIYTYYQ